MIVNVAVFGGGFDPFHNGHMQIVQAVLSNATYNIDEFYLVPSYDPPHKEPHIASFNNRLNMLNSIINEFDDRVFISDYELISKNKSFTLNTLQYLKDILEIKNLYFVTGSDIFATIKTWHEYQSIPLLADFIIFERNGYSFEKMIDSIGEIYNEWNDQGVITLDYTNIVSVNSTDMRIDLNKNLLPAQIYDYIIEHNLYR